MKIVKQRKISTDLENPLEWSHALGWCLSDIENNIKYVTEVVISPIDSSTLQVTMFGKKYE